MKNRTTFYSNQELRTYGYSGVCKDSFKVGPIKFDFSRGCINSWAAPRELRELEVYQILIRINKNTYSILISSDCKDEFNLITKILNKKAAHKKIFDILFEYIDIKFILNEIFEEGIFVGKVNKTLEIRNVLSLEDN